MYRLIIADDEAIIRSGLARSVDWVSLGHTMVGAFSCGNDVIHFLQDNAADVLLTDIRMEDGSGMELAQWIARHRPGMQIILLTGYADYETACQAVSYGVVRCLLNKPVPVGELKSVFVALAQDLAEKSKREAEQRQLHLTCLQLILRQEAYAETLWENFHMICVAVRIDGMTEWEIPVLQATHTTARYEGLAVRADGAMLLLYPCHSGQADEVMRLAEAWLALQEGAVQASLRRYDDARAVQSLVGGCDENGPGEPTSSILDAVNLYLDQHQTDRIYLADVAARFHYSASHFSRIFQKSAGMSFAAYVLRKKLECAREGLLHTDASIAEVAAAAGFVDARHFAQAFKRQFGLTPSACRRQQGGR